MAFSAVMAVGAAVSAAVGVHNTIEAGKEREQMRIQRVKQEDQQRAGEEQIKNQERRENIKTMVAAKNEADMRDAKRRKAMGPTDFGGTLLTGPGVMPEPQSATKTLLGA